MDGVFSSRDGCDLLPHLIFLGVLADAEETLLQFTIRLEPGRFHHPVDAAVDHDGDFFSDRARDTDVLLDDENTDFALFTEIDQNFFDTLDDHRRKPFRRLVHDQQARIEKKCARDGEHLLLAAGELIAAIGATLSQAREGFVDARNIPVSSPAGGEPQMLINGERRPQPPSLRHVAETEPRDFRR